MSKKSRLKKKNKQKLQKRFDQQVAPAVVGNVDIADENISVDEKPAASDEKKVAVDESQSIIDTPTRKLIGKDVRMIIFTLVGLILVLVAVRILQLHTTYIDNFGNWLYKISNIQTM
jgi:hypothetical protein